MSTGGIARRIQQGREFLREGLWREPERRGIGRGLRLLQLGVLVAEGFVRDLLLLRATALTYFTVLSLIPIIAVALSIVRAIGVGGEEFSETVARVVVEQVAAGSPEAQSKIVSLIDQVNFGAMGTLGAGFLFLTTVLGISNVERALNAIWGIHKPRPFGRRFADYLAVLVVAPILMGFALSLGTTLQSQWVVQRIVEVPGLALLYELGLRYVPVFVLAGVFTFLYWFLPNTRVRPVPAMVGGLVAGVLVVLAQSLYVELQVGAARANAVFGGFAALPLLFVWIYFFWAIVLFGAEVAFAHQNLASYRSEARAQDLEPAEREAVALYVATELARAFREGQGRTPAELADLLAAPVRAVRSVLEELEAAGLVAERAGDGEEESYQLGRAADRVPVTDVLHAIRGAREPLEGEPGVSASLERVMAEIAEGEARAAAGRTLEDLAKASDA